MRVLAVTLGSHGDVLPILAIGRALVARGHQCAVVAHSFFTPETRAAGLEPLPIATAVRYEDIVRQPDLFHRYRGPRLVGRMLEDAIVPTVDALRAEIARRRPDVLLTHYILLGAQWLAEAERLPCAVVVLSPVGWLSATDPVPALQIAPGGPAAALAAVGMRVLHPVVRAMTDRWANAMRAATGFPPGRDLLWTDMRGGDASLGMWSSAFRPACRDDPPRGVICGFPWWDGGRDGIPGGVAGSEAALGGVEAALEAFVSAGDPPLVFSLGSAAVHHASDYFTIAAECCARLGRRGVLLTGGAEYDPSHLPRGVRAFAWAPHSWIFPRSAATIHHGGIGSTAQALRAGRPQLVVPHAHDQFNNAVRIVRLGLGAMVPRHRLTVARLIRALGPLLDDAAVGARARGLGARVGAEDGAVTAVTVMERLAAAPRRDAPGRTESG